MKSNYIYSKNYDNSYIASSNKMGGKKRGEYIYVEGEFDEKVFRKSRPEIGNLFRGIGTKEKVIRIVKNSETDCKGIVDMDHDLKGDEISFTDKIVDTNNACCLFGHLVKNCNEENILIRFCKEIIGKLNLDNAEKIKAYNQLDEEKDVFLEFIYNLTIIDLFKGKYNDSTPKEKREKINWILVTINMDGELKKLVESNNFRKFNDYRTNEVKREEIGLNDHAFEDAIRCLVGKYTNDYQKKIKFELTRIILRDFDKLNPDISSIVKKLA